MDQRDQIAVSGRVRTSDGAPIAGAAVTLADLSGRQVAVAQTSAAGDYRLTAPSAGSYLVIVSAPGHHPAAGTLTAGAAGASHDVVMRGGSGLAGTVRASSGQPVSGATVTLADGRGEIAAAVTTGTDGSFALTHLPAGPYTLVVAAAACAPVAVRVVVADGELARHDVELPASGRVTGTVLTAAGDHPFPGARLSLVGDAGAEVAVVAADGDGQFTFGDVPAARYTLVASGYRPGVTALPAAPASNHRVWEADITLSPPG